MEDPSYWHTVHDKLTGKDVVLSDLQLDMIQRIQKTEYPETSYNPYEVGLWVPFLYSDRYGVGIIHTMV